MNDIFALIIQYCDWDRVDDIVCESGIGWDEFKQKFFETFGTQYRNLG